MRKARLFLAVLLALSVIIVPMTAGMAAPGAQKSIAAASVDCDRHQHGHAFPQETPPVDDHCVAMVNCGLCCVTLTGTGIVMLSHDAGMGAALEPLRLSGPSLSWLTAPPLRPPRA